MKEGDWCWSKAKLSDELLKSQRVRNLAKLPKCTFNPFFNLFETSIYFRCCWLTHPRGKNLTVSSFSSSLRLFGWLKLKKKVKNFLEVNKSNFHFFTVVARGAGVRKLCLVHIFLSLKALSFMLK